LEGFDNNAADHYKLSHLPNAIPDHYALSPSGENAAKPTQPTDHYVLSPSSDPNSSSTSTEAGSDPYSLSPTVNKKAPEKAPSARDFYSRTPQESAHKGTYQTAAEVATPAPTNEGDLLSPPDPEKPSSPADHYSLTPHAAQSPPSAPSNADTKTDKKSTESNKSAKSTVSKKPVTKEDPYSLSPSRPLNQSSSADQP
jgi:hypothetical protein